MSGPIVTLDLGNSPWCTATPAQIVENLRDGGRLCREWIADEIERQIPQPKPAEPTGRYAVVVDADGSEWVRDGLDADKAHSGPWWNATSARMSDGDARRANYADISAVRVLSEGVFS